MQRWLRRLAYGLVVLVWLILMLAPIVAVVLAARGQIQVGEGPRRYVRLFLVQEEEAQGVGLEWVRPADGQTSCSDGSLRYFTWEGEGQNADFCQCYDEAGEVLTSVTQEACREEDH
jgi:hypothetical protein